MAIKPTKSSKPPITEQFPKNPKDQIAGDTADISTPKRFAGRIVAITIKAKSGWARWNFVPAPLLHVKSENHHIVENKQEIKEALGKLKDDDILIFNAHANDEYFIYGRSNTKVYWTQKNSRVDIWKHFELDKKPPRLATVIMASCMKRPGEHLALPRLRELRKAFHTRLIIAPDSRYELEYNDNNVADTLIGHILRFYNGQTDAAELNERINRDQDRFRVSYGCNGWNHPDGCCCRFGPRWKDKR